MARLFGRCLGPLIRLMHRPTLEGWERLPTDRPYLLVANHSGGGLSEIGALATVWLKQFGSERPLAGMTHPVFLHYPVTAPALLRLGAIPSTYVAALSTLEAGIPVLVFPGGGYEAFRPLWQAYRVDLAGRKGFLRIARRAWVPIIPLGIRGSHFTMPILWRSRLLSWLYVLPRLVGIKCLGLPLLGAVVAFLLLWFLGPVLGYGWAGLLAYLAIPFTLFPWVPWTIRLRVGEPIEPEDLFGEQDEAGPLPEAYTRVETALQELVRATP